MARNLAVVKLNSANEVISSGPIERGSFFDYTGKKKGMMNRGVLWLTSLGNLTEHVVRIKTARLGPDTNLLVYEKWSTADYISTHMLLIDDDGTIVQDATQSSYE